MANLIQNGSFENPVVPVASATHTAAVPPWQTTDVDFEIWSNGFQNTHSADGNQNLEILSRTPTGTSTTVFQKVRLQAGQGYKLSFAYAARPNQKSKMELMGNNVVMATFDLQGGPAGSDFKWQTFSMSFVSPVTVNATIGFRDRRIPAGGAGTHIDNVRLETTRGAPLTLASLRSQKKSRGKKATGKGRSGTSGSGKKGKRKK